MVCMALLVISLAETILIVRLVHKQDLQQPVPLWLRHLVLERIAGLLCLGEQLTSHRGPATLQATKTDDFSGERGRGEPHPEGPFPVWFQGHCRGSMQGVVYKESGTAWGLDETLYMAPHIQACWEQVDFSRRCQSRHPLHFHAFHKPSCGQVAWKSWSLCVSGAEYLGL